MSCEPTNINESNNLIRITINDTDFDKVIYDESEIIKDIQYIPLETIDSVNLIGSVSKVVCYENKIYVLDRKVTKALYIFNMDGTYLDKISRIGDGPGEFKMPHNFIILEEDKLIALYCRQNNKLLYYTLNGQHLYDERVELSFKSFFFKDNHRLFFTHSVYNYMDGFGKILFDYIVLDESNKPIVKQYYNGVDVGVSKPVMTHNHYFTEIDGDIYLSWIFNDTIYQIDDNFKAKPYLFLDFGISSIPVELFEQGDQMAIFQSAVIEGQYGCKSGPFLATNDLRIVSISAGLMNTDGPGLFIALLSKDYNDKLIFSKINFKDDALTRMPIATYNEYFISVLYPEEILLEKMQDGLEKDISLNGIQKEIYEFDNPILMFTSYNDYEN